MTSLSSTNKLVELQETLYRSKNPTRRWLHCSRHDWIVDALHRTTPEQPGRAMEVGPGSGIYLPTLARLYQEVVAMDKETAYLNHAQRLIEAHPNVSLLVNDITASHLPDAGFDLILCTEVVEHIADSSAAIAEMRRLLKPRGVLVLSTPQRYSLLEVTAKIAFLPGIIDLVRLVYREPIVEMGHINLMTTSHVTDQLQRAGFTIQERFKSGMYLPLIAEFTGHLGLKFEQWLEVKLRGGYFDGILWTQYYIARA